MFYSAFAPYCGFKVNFGEYKLILDRVIDLKPDGSFQLDISFFRFDTNVSVISPLFEALFGQPTRRPEAPLE